jgi:hypothetical protein
MIKGIPFLGFKIIFPGTGMSKECGYYTVLTQGGLGVIQANNLAQVGVELRP